jgi:hypothetical protein
LYFIKNEEREGREAGRRKTEKLTVKSPEHVSCVQGPEVSDDQTIWRRKASAP